jgi:hypothetical protein
MCNRNSIAPCMIERKDHRKHGQILMNRTPLPLFGEVDFPLFLDD